MLNLPDTFNSFLSADECAQIDQTLLPTRDRFSIRVTIYSWRYLQQVSQGLGVTIADLQPQQILDWLHTDTALQKPEFADDAFQDLFGRLLTASLAPLQKIAQQDGVTIEQLTVPSIVQWFEQQAKATLNP